MHVTFHIFAALVFLATLSNAHQPFESNARVQFDRDCMELTVTTSMEIAGALTGGSIINGVTVEGLRPQLLNVGRELYEVTANGKPLKGERAFFFLSDEDAVFSVVYPLVRGVEMSFRADYLEQLANGYSGSIAVSDAGPDETEMLLLGRKSLMTKDPSRISFSLHVPEVPFNPESQAEDVPVQIDPTMPVELVSGDARPQGYQLFLLAGGICGVSILAWGARCLFRRNGKKTSQPIVC